MRLCNQANNNGHLIFRGQAQWGQICSYVINIREKSLLFWQENKQLKLYLSVTKWTSPLLKVFFISRQTHAVSLSFKIDVNYTVYSFKVHKVIPILTQIDSSATREVNIREEIVWPTCKGYIIFFCKCLATSIKIPPPLKKKERKIKKKTRKTKTKPQNMEIKHTSKKS